VGTEYDPAFEPTTAERIARNDAVFRDANDRIHDAAIEHGGDGDAFPAICECADPGCREIFTITLTEYEQVRLEPRQFLNVPGHESGSTCRVVGRRDGYVVVEKTGRAGQVAERLARGGGELVPPQSAE
jgi:hypothetical protein